MKILERIGNVCWSIMVSGIGAFTIIGGLKCVKYGKECFEETFKQKD